MSLPRTAVDTETYGDITKTDPYHPSIKMAYLSYWGDSGGEVYSVKDPSHEEGLANVAKNILANPKVVKLFHNAAFDIPVLQKFGFKIRGPVEDTLIKAQTVLGHEKRHGLKFLAQKFLGLPYNEEIKLKAWIKKHGCDYGSVPYRVIAPYALKDARVAWEIDQFLSNIIDEQEMHKIWAMEMELLPVVIGMMRRGIRVDADRVSSLVVQIRSEGQEGGRKLLELTKGVEVSPNSPKAVRDFLWPQGGSPIKTKTGQDSTCNTALLMEGSEVALAILKARKRGKAYSNYLKPLMTRPDANDHIHVSLNQGGTVTGRFSSSDINLHNQPRPGDDILGRIRECYIADEDYYLVFIDYEQIQMRLLAHFSQQQHMLDTILRGESLHANTCKLLFNIEEGHDDYGTFYYLSKRLNFATVFGTGATTFRLTVLDDTNGKLNLDEDDARSYIRKWWEGHDKVRELQVDVLNKSVRDGGVRTHYGRLIPVAYGKSHAVLNYSIQGNEADIVKYAMLRAAKFLKPYLSRLILQVHDELIFMVHKSEKAIIPELVRLMEVRDEFTVPITCSVEYSKRWSNKKKLILSVA